MNDDHDLLGAYCADALDPREREQFEEHLALCAACREEAVGFREVLAALADTEPVRPPAGLEDLVIAAARSGGPRGSTPDGSKAADPQGTSALTPAPPTRAVPLDRRGWARVAPWLAAAAAGAMLFAAGVGVGRTQLPAESAAVGQMAEVVDVASAADARVMAVDIMGTTSRVVVSDEMGKSVFLASELPMPAKGMCYQVWRVTDDGQMISAGTLTPDTDGHVAAVLEGGTTDVAGFMITMEPPGGSEHPTGEKLGEVDA